MKVVFDVCQFCKQEFEKTGNNHKFCSEVCYVKSRVDYYSNWRKSLSVEYGMLHGAKCRAKKKGIEFTISKEDLKIPSHCPILGIPIKRNVGSGYHPDSPSLDRIDNSKGYTPDNIRVISNRANLLKCDATLEELEALVVDARSI